MASTINTSHSENLFRPQLCKISNILMAGDDTLAVGDGTLTIEWGTLTVGDDTLAIGGGTLTVGDDTLAVGGGTLTVDGGTLMADVGMLAVGGGTLMVDDSTWRSAVVPWWEMANTDSATPLLAW
jgi:hypothetical protein